MRSLSEYAVDEELLVVRTYCHSGLFWYLLSFSRYGSCMAQLGESTIAEATGLDCQGRWVTFGCSGEHVSKAEARHLYDAAQLELASGCRAMVLVDDGRKHDDYCFASRIDVLAE